MKTLNTAKTMKIIMTILLALSIILGPAGCADNNTNQEASSEAQKESGSGCTYDFPMTGFGFDLPEGMEITKGYINPYDVGDMDYNTGVMMGWPVYYAVTKEKYYNMTAEDYEKVKTGFSFQIFCVKDVDTLDEAIEKMISVTEKITGEEMSKEEKESTSKMKEIHRENGYMWIAYRNDKAEVSEECREEYEAFYNAFDEIVEKYMKFYPPDVWEGTEEGSNISFETEDLEGNPVKSDTLFSNNKVTMINIWSTTCGPCIQEMPELEKLNKEFAKKGGAIIGAVVDVPVGNNMYLQEAKDIVKDTGVTYTNIRAWDDFDSMFATIGTPTTYFVDSQGNIIGDPIVGASLNMYKTKMEELLSQAQ